MGIFGKKTRDVRRSVVKRDDVVFSGGRETDIIIPVMGKTGVGKSTFINTLFGVGKVQVCHDMRSCSAPIHAIIMDSQDIKSMGEVNEKAATIFRRLGDRRVIIVDTPGFDDTFIPDAEILRRISVWLGKSYSSNMKLGGIIYLHNIGERRMEGASLRNLEVFQELCGSQALNRVILGTTSWNEVGTNVGEAREKQLTQEFWRQMLNAGSTMVRIDGRRQSAVRILTTILSRVSGEAIAGPVLKIQQELVDMQKYIPETGAGRKLRDSLVVMMDSMLESENAEDDEKVRVQVQSVKEQMQELRIPGLIFPAHPAC